MYYINLKTRLKFKKIFFQKKSYLDLLKYFKLLTYFIIKKISRYNTFIYYVISYKMNENKKNKFRGFNNFNLIDIIQNDYPKKNIINNSIKIEERIDSNKQKLKKNFLLRNYLLLIIFLIYFFKLLYF